MPDGGGFLKEIGRYLADPATTYSRADATLTAQRYLLRRFAFWARGRKIKGWGAVTRAQVERYLATRRWPRPERSALRQFFSWRGQENPARLARLPGVAQTWLRPRAATPEEAKKLLEPEARDHPIVRRDQALVELLHQTGLRRSEALELRVGDIDLARGVVDVRAPKTRSERQTWLEGLARKTMARWLQARPGLEPKSDHLFVTQGGQAMSARGLNQMLVRRGARRGVRVSTQQLRHHYADSLWRNGAPLDGIRQLLGHASSRTTETYLSRPTLADQRAALEKLPRNRNTQPEVATPHENHNP